MLKTNKIGRLFFIVATSCLVGLGHASNEDFSEATLIESPTPKHPYEAYMTTEADSGAVEVIFTVNEQGVPKNLLVVRSSQPQFEEQALIAVAKYRYKPALKNGKPVKATQRVHVIFDHSRIRNRSGFPGPMEIPNGFGSYFNKISTWLSKPNPDERKIRHTLKKMQDLSYQTFSTEVHTELIKMRIEEAFGKEADQIEPIKRLLMFTDVKWNGKSAIDDEYLQILRIKLLNLRLQLNQFAEFLREYREFSLRNSEIETAFQAAEEQVDDIRRSDAVIERQVTISTRGYIVLPLLKSSFVVEVLQGGLEGFELRCTARHQEFEFQANAQYDIPPNWGACEMQLNGAPQTQVSVLQQ